MPDSHFNFYDHSKKRYLTKAEAERELVDVFMDAERYEAKAAELSQIDDFWLHVLALMVNPSLRQTLWNATLDDGEPVLSERMKFFLIVNSPENEGAALELARTVIHQVVSELYVEQEVET